MYILPLIGYLGVLVGFIFLTLAIASGLYYLSELVESHTVLTKRLLTRTIHSIIILQILLYLIDALPFLPTLLSILSHATYALNLRRFPLVQLSDPIFLLSCVLVGLNHWVWFRFWSDPARVSPISSSAKGGDYYAGGGVVYPSFMEIASFFGLCVWLVPFALFVSLSAGENVLPYTYTPSEADASASTGGMGVSGSGLGESNDRRKKRVGMAKAVVEGVREWVGEMGRGVGIGTGGSRF